jgi:alanine racemase
LLSPQHPVDELAARAGTIGYEILTSLGHRYARCYLPA